MRIVVSLSGAMPRAATGYTPADLPSLQPGLGNALAPLTREHDLVIHTGGDVGRPELSEPAACAEPVHADVAGLLSLERELHNALPATKPVAVLLALVELNPAGTAPALPRRILDTRPVEWLLAQSCVVLCSSPAAVAYVAGRRQLKAVDVSIDADEASAVLAEDLAADLLVMVTASPLQDRGLLPHQRRTSLRPEHIATGTLPAREQARVRAAARFAGTRGRTSVIATREELPQILPAGRGLWIETA